MTLARNSRLALALCALLALAPFAQAQGKRAKKPLPAKAQPAIPAPLRAGVARFAKRVDAILAKPEVAKGHWGVLILDRASGQPLYQRNAESFFVPASVTKIFTTAFALATLGPDFRFRTTLETRGTLDPAGKLTGDLVLVGRGDPNLSNLKLPFTKEDDRIGPREKALAELADALVKRGIKEIEGDVVGDDTYFPYDRWPVGWAIGDTTWRQGAPVSAIAVNDNTVQLLIRPGEKAGDPAVFVFDPRSDYCRVTSSVTTGARGSKAELGLRREPGSLEIRLWGSLPEGGSVHTLNVALEDPAEFAAALLKRLLEERSVTISGKARAKHWLVGTPAPAPLPEPPAVLAEHLSLPLGEAVRVVNKISRNLHAELLLRTAVREKSGDGSLEAALKLEQEFLKGAGVPEADVALEDGSGLTRQNLVTPRAAVKLLEYVGKQSWADDYWETLPLAGNDGTLNERLKKLPAATVVEAKTGTLEHTNGLAGRATTLRGATLVFAMFGNAHTLRDGAATLDALVLSMVEEIGPEPPRKKKR
jgi:D-alanyl-D-alanine carboxypeptidase/D-alanyl-D-alanine-endopeptidase (penicillin-binding protein 4)